jgi:hypothetical protein
MSSDSENYGSELATGLQLMPEMPAPSGETGTERPAPTDIGQVGLTRRRQEAMPTPTARQVCDSADDAAMPIQAPSEQVDAACDHVSGANLATQGPVLESIAEDLRPLAVPIGGLRPAPDNARLHADQDVRALMESLRRFGQRKAIVAKHEYRGIRNAVLAGSGTLLAARRLGWTHLAVSWFDGSDDAAQAYAIADNATAELSEWNVTQLAADLDAGLDFGAFFDPDALQDLLGADAPVPDFPSVHQDEQGRLDRIEPITCPECGHVFHR